MRSSNDARSLLMATESVWLSCNSLKNIWLNISEGLFRYFNQFVCIILTLHRLDDVLCRVPTYIVCFHMEYLLSMPDCPAVVPTDS